MTRSPQFFSVFGETAEMPIAAVRMPSPASRGMREACAVKEQAFAAFSLVFPFFFSKVARLAWQVLTSSRFTFPPLILQA